MNVRNIGLILISYSVSNNIRVQNYTGEPLVLKRHDHICQIRTVNNVNYYHSENDLTGNDPSSRSQM